MFRLRSEPSRAVVDRFSIVRSLALQVLLVAAASAAAREAFDKKKNEAELLEWIRSKGGYWNPKQDLRYDEVVPDLYGVYATETIEENEVLAAIPWDCVIAPENDNDNGNDSSPVSRFLEPPPDRFDDNCNLVRRLADELAKTTTTTTATTTAINTNTTTKSRYSHYVEGLLQTAADHHALLPVHWSEAGKKLMEAILFDGGGGESLQVLPPEDAFLEDDEWKRNCEKRVDPTATLLVMTHGEDFGMVPLTDKYNHRGGDRTGAYFSLENGHGDIALEIRALRELERGEPIYTDYRDYGPVVGTPELLRDYGFVEFYPQRWIFPKLGLAFDVVQRQQQPTDETESYEVRWHAALRGLFYEGKPHSDSIGIEHFRIQKERLEKTIPPLLSANDNDNGNATQHELQTVSLFYDSLVRALGLAIFDAEHATPSEPHREL